MASGEVENGLVQVECEQRIHTAQGGQASVAKQVRGCPEQMKYVNHTEAGEGLMFDGNVVLPVIDRFAKETELYRVMTTKPEEVGEA